MRTIIKHAVWMVIGIIGAAASTVSAITGESFWALWLLGAVLNTYCAVWHANRLTTVTAERFRERRENQLLTTILDAQRLDHNAVYEHYFVPGTPGITTPAKDKPRDFATSPPKAHGWKED